LVWKTKKPERYCQYRVLLVLSEGDEP
jgi:hypothetical protein